jgi:hypothetical protein
VSVTVPGKIIQIAVGSGTGGTAATPDVLFALCDDGTVWRLSLKLHQAVWYLLPPLPTSTPEPLPMLFDGTGA